MGQTRDVWLSFSYSNHCIWKTKTESGYCQEATSEGIKLESLQNFTVPSIRNKVTNTLTLKGGENIITLAREQKRTAPHENSWYLVSW